MKTLFVTAFLAVAIGACSSDTSSSPLVTNAQGTVPQGGPCNASGDCEPTLTCAYPMNSDAGACKATGTCVAMGPCSYLSVCPCTGGAAVTACVSESFSSVAVSSGTCAGTPASDASTGGSTSGG
jgi:hypothetical protein